jgi:hypothetical protein
MGDCLQVWGYATHQELKNQGVKIWLLDENGNEVGQTGAGVT